MDDDLKAQVPPAGLRRQVILDRQDAPLVQSRPLLLILVRRRGVVKDVMRRRQVERAIWIGTTPNQVGQALQSARRQLVAAGLKMVIPHGLVQKMAILHLRRKGGDHFLPCGILIPLGVAGIDEVPVAVAATDDRQATRHAERGHDSFHTIGLLCAAAFSSPYPLPRG